MILRSFSDVFSGAPKMGHRLGKSSFFRELQPQVTILVIDEVDALLTKAPS